MGPTAFFFLNFASQLKELPIMHIKKISSREREILELIAHEYTTPQIAAELYLSTHTVDSHKKNIKVKLNVKNSAGMVRKGYELGLLRISNSSVFRMYTN